MQTQTWSNLAAWPSPLLTDCLQLPSKALSCGDSSSDEGSTATDLSRSGPLPALPTGTLHCVAAAGEVLNFFNRRRKQNVYGTDAGALCLNPWSLERGVS